MKEVWILAFLSWNSWVDIKKHEISPVLTGLFGVAGFIWTCFSQGISWDFPGVLSIGIIAIVVSFMTKGALGMGDGILLLALGSVMRMEELLGIFLLGLIFSAVWGTILLVVQKKARNIELPFVPFLLLGYVGGLILW